MTQEDKDSKIRALLWLSSTAALTLIMLNLIIAIMSDTYEKVMTNIHESDYEQIN